MDDRIIILNAYKASVKTKRRRKTCQDIFSDGLDAFSESEGLPDAISVALKRKAKRSAHQRKKVSSWSQTDFLRYIHTLLSSYGMSYEPQGPQGDRLSVGRTYDMLADCYQNDMNNYVLKNFYEWWVSMYAQRMYDNLIYIRTIGSENNVSQFLSNVGGLKIDQAEIPAPEDAEEPVDAAASFEIGGLSMVVMEYGIVAGYRVLKDQRADKVLNQITKILESFDKKVLDQVMRKTIRRSPYPEADKIDFISLARPRLEFYDLKEYIQFQYEKYFLPH